MRHTMELLERSRYLDDLAGHYRGVEEGNGHTIFLMGEAGIGKTSLVNHFLKEVESSAVIYSGSCDSLFTPRPLGPLFDIAGQLGGDFLDFLRIEKDRSQIFSALVQRLSSSLKPVVLVFEDIHWADEATVDLVKFLARRIYHHRCLFLLTFRDGEIHTGHPLSSIFGELPSGHFSKVLIDRFSRDTVDHLCAKKGYTTGRKVYDLTGGNPFYVSEILASYSLGIPERVKDSILTVFRARSEDTKALWEFLSILPSSRIDLNIAKRIESEFANCIDTCIASGVIVSRPGHMSFKHELFRLAIEESLQPSKRKSLHKKMLDIMLEGTVDSHNLSQLVHHARYADEREIVARIAPQAAKEAAAVGAHIEASKLYSTAIEYTDKQDPAIVELYERHAYECYLTYQVAAAIDSQQHALDIWKARKNSLKEGDASRFLSRLWWFEGNQEKTMALALRSIEVLENGFPTRERAWAYSNFSQLSMLSEQRDKALHWGNKAIDLATNMEDKEILSHALNNVGAMLLKIPSSEKEGVEHLNRSLSIALDNGFHEHVARAYVNLSSSFVYAMRYEKAMAVFDLGLKYCEDHELDSWTYYLRNCKVRALFEIGKWQEAEILANSMPANLHHPGVVNIDAITSLAKLNMRRGKFEEARIMIRQAKARAKPTHEPQRIIPVLTAELELAWIGEGPIPLEEIKEAEETLFYDKNNSWHYTLLAYWMHKCAIPQSGDFKVEFAGPFKRESEGDWRDAAEEWKQIDRPFEEALALFDGEEEHQKQSLIILDALGATATIEMLRSKLKLMGVKKIPRGPRESTRNNPAQLTGRQIEILALLQHGSQNKEIAEKLFISPKTVDHHISAILSKLDVHTRAKAVVEAHKLGILK